MSDLKMYRRFYPAILNYTFSDAQAESASVHMTPDVMQHAQQAGIDPQDLLQTMRQFPFLIAEDVDLGKKIGILHWKEGVEMLQEKIPLWRHQHISTMPAPFRQLLSTTTSHQSPFAFLDEGKNEYVVSLFMRNIGGPLIDKTHERISRGHAWFGIGQWNIAVYRYLEGLGMAIASNNDAAVESLVRFLVDVYVAAGKSDTARLLINDFWPYKDRIFSPKQEMQRAIEDTCFGLMMEGKKQESIKVLLQVTEIGRKINSDVRTWRIVNLLLDIFEFMGETNALKSVQRTVDSMLPLLNALEE